MLRNQRFYCYPSVNNLKFLLFLFKTVMRASFLVIPLLLANGQALAGRVAALYDVSILVVDESASIRQQAFKQGLDEVFIRISGDSIVMDKLKRPPSSRYVKQFSYDPVPVSAATAPLTNAKGEKLTQHLKIQYNGRFMEKYLLDNGFPVWSEHRPDVVVWLAVRDGTNEYVLKDTDKSLLKTAVDEALIRRGVPERWPLYDKKDRKILSVADIRGGFKEPVKNASQRYSRGPALAGSMIWNGKQWQSSWSLLMEAGNRYWSLADADYNLLINKAIDQAADAMGVVFAIHSTEQQLTTIQLDIQSVSSIENFRHVEDYLTGLSAVKKAKLLRIDAQNAVFEVTLRSNEKDFLNLIKNDAELAEVKVQEIKAQEILTQEIKAQLIPESKQSVDDQTATVQAENASATKIEVIATEKGDALPFVKQQNQVPLYHYRLIK
jgi:hypothetical protein